MTVTLFLGWLGSLIPMLRAYAGGTIFGHQTGELPVAVVYLHGWGRTGSDFDATIAATGLSSLALDLPGFGASPLPTHAGGARDYAQLLLPVLREIGRPVILVGHSFGGRVAVCLAAAHPELVSSLVLTGVPLLRRRGTKKSPVVFRLARRAHRWHLVSDARMESLRRRHGSADYRAAHGLLRDILVTTIGESYEAELARVDCLTHFVWGEADHDVPVEIMMSAKSFVRQHVTTVVPQVGHHLPTQAPVVLADAVLAAVAS